MDITMIILILIAAVVIVYLFKPDHNPITKEWIKDVKKIRRLEKLKKPLETRRSYHRHCDLCHQEIRAPWEYLDRHEFEYLISGWNNKRIRAHVCSTCAYMIANQGLLTIPMFDPGEQKCNEFGTYGRRFDKKNDLWKFMMKADLFLNLYHKKYKVTRVKPTSRFLPIGYDVVIDNKPGFVKHRDIMNFLKEQFYKNNECCTHCGEVIYTEDRLLRDMKEIDANSSLSDVERYGMRHELHKNKSHLTTEPYYFIKSDDSGIAILHQHCIDSAIHKHEIKPFHVVLYYDDIKQITDLVK